MPSKSESFMTTPSADPNAQGQERPCRELAEAVARVFERDPHSWSNRGCQTCKAVSAILDRDFGCVAYAKAGRSAAYGVSHG